MAINFSNGKEISELAVNKLYAEGSICQCVQVTNAGNHSVGNNTLKDIFNASITTSRASNKVLTYFYVTERMDFGGNRWSIMFNYLRYDGPSGANQNNSYLVDSGWNGTYRFYLGAYEKYYLHSPGVAGTHTYTVRCQSYNAGTGYVNYGGNQGGDGTGVIRLMEVGA